MQFDYDIAFPEQNTQELHEIMLSPIAKKHSEAQKRDAIRYRRALGYVCKPIGKINCYKLLENSNEIRIIERASHIHVVYLKQVSKVSKDFTTSKIHLQLDLTLQLPRVIRTEFLFTISIQYQADKQRERLPDPVPNSLNQHYKNYAPDSKENY